MQFRRESDLPCSAREAFEWHARDGAFERLAPPWDRLEVVSRTGSGIDEGSTIRLRLRKFGIGKEWLAKISDRQEGAYFKDVQVEGPFARWEHCHAFKESESDSCLLEDQIDYALPGGPIVNAIAGSRVRSELDRVFSYRHEITKSDLEFWIRYKNQERLNVLISGGYGFIGSRLSSFLRSQGHKVAILSRSPRVGDVGWDPDGGGIASDQLEGFDAVIHLAGENLAAGRWTEKRKTRLWKSRVEATQFLVEAFKRVKRRPRTFICASGIGYYGDRGDEVVREGEPLGQGFLAGLCQAWESEAIAAEDAFDRTFRLRTGVVLDAKGGALGKMLLPFRMGLGGALGKGSQWMSWIALEDWIGSVYHLLMEGASGPFNLVSPNPVTSRDFARTLGSVLERPAFMDVPAPILKLLLGEFADEGLLSSCRAYPAALELSGYRFRYPDLGDALRLTLGCRAKAG